MRKIFDKRADLKPRVETLRQRADAYLDDLMCWKDVHNGLVNLWEVMDPLVTESEKCWVTEECWDVVKELASLAPTSMADRTEVARRARGVTDHLLRLLAVLE